MNPLTRRMSKCALLAALLFGFSISSWAVEYSWFPQGDGTSFSDPGNWYNNSTGENPSGPPGAADIATLASGAAVTASGGSINQLNGFGTATLTLNGPFSVQTVAGGGMTLAGSGELTAQTVTSALNIVGGHMTAVSYSAGSLSVDASGSLKINGGVQSPGPSQSFLFNVVNGATLDLQGAANDVDGGIESGAHATLASLANLNISQATLDVNGANTLLTISASGSIRNNSLDIASGASVTVNGSLSLQGANSSGTSTSASSHWQGAGTTVTIGTGLTIGKGTGDYVLNLATGAQIASGAGIVLGSDSGGSGTLAMSDGGDVELGGGTMVVGQLGQGTVTMDTSAQLKAGTLSLGRSALNNQLTAGQDTILGVTSELVVGDGGHGTLHLTSGAAAVVKRLVVGRSSQADNHVTVEGAETTLSGSGRIDVGELNGRGTFDIQSTAQAQPSGGLSVGIYDGSTGALTISDGAEIDTGSSDAIIGGGASSQATMSLRTGGKLTALDVLIFAKPGGSSTVNLTGSPASPLPTLLFASREIQVGFTHDAAGPTLLQVTNGAFARAAQTLIVGKNGVFDTRGGSTAVGTTDFPPNGTVRVGFHGFLGGPGTFIGTVEQELGGIVSPGASPGILTIQGNYQMKSDGVLNIEIAGTTAGTNYDSLNITGTAAISGGTLAINFINGFAPKSGQIYTFLQATGGMSGSFSNVQVTGVAPGFWYHFVTNNAAGSLSLQADNNGAATSAPHLDFSTSGGSITLTWPASTTWGLKTSTNVLSGWTAVSGTLQNDQYTVTLPMTQPQAFFRLFP